MNEKIGELMAAGIPYATAATIIGNPAAADSKCTSPKPSALVPETSALIFLSL